jgi:hypothetical protein
MHRGIRTPTAVQNAINGFWRVRKLLPVGLSLSPFKSLCVPGNAM